MQMQKILILVSDIEEDMLENEEREFFDRTFV